MRILHLTDTHLFADPAARHYDRIDTAAALERVLERLADIAADRPVDLVLHTGDASEDASEDSYRRLHAMLDPVAAALGAELLVVMGNHDSSAAYAAVAGPGDHDAADHDAADHDAADHDADSPRGASRQDRARTLASGWRTVVLDSSVPGAGYGRLDAAQLAWLREVLAEPSEHGTVLAIHHPPLTAATPLLRALDLQDRDALADAIVGTDVRLICSGHYHHPMTGALAGVPVHVAPGVTNVMDPLSGGGREQARALSGASVIDLGGTDDAADATAAPVITTAVWPNAGDVLGDGEVPVYDFSQQQVAAIIAASVPDGTA